jgi:hypothetical protein
MDTIRRQIAPLLGIFMPTGCAVHRYHPAPIVASEMASRLESRNLSDTGLHSFEEMTLGHQVSPWPPKTWGLQTLSIAALYFNPALDVPRARVAALDAAIVTAGARPNPTFTVAPGVPSPYLLSLDLRSSDPGWRQPNACFPAIVETVGPWKKLPRHSGYCESGPAHSQLLSFRGVETLGLGRRVFQPFQSGKRCTNQSGVRLRSDSDSKIQNTDRRTRRSPTSILARC